MARKQRRKLMAPVWVWQDAQLRARARRFRNQAALDKWVNEVGAARGKPPVRFAVSLKNKQYLDPRWGRDARKVPTASILNAMLDRRRVA